MDAESTAGNPVDRVSGKGVTPLTFTAVDGLAFADQKGRTLSPKAYAFSDIGPLLELRHLFTDSRTQTIEAIVGDQNVAPVFTALNQGRRRLWICPSTKKIGFLRTSTLEADVKRSYHFGMAAQNAAVSAGFSKEVARQLVAAILEMIDNVYVHSTVSETGLAAFQSRSGWFEFVVVDHGIGILKSLQSSAEYSGLSDHGDALQVALTDGCSRFGPDSNHGHGFRNLFVGLSNLNGALRFRTGDHALIIDGRNPASIPWMKVAKPKIPGFLASVSCQTEISKRNS